MKDFIQYLIWVYTDIRIERKANGMKSIPLLDAIKSYRIMKEFSKRWDKGSKI